MRIVTFVIIALLSAPPAAYAVEWRRHEHAQLGYALDLPADWPEFAVADSGAARVFSAGPGISLIVFAVAIRGGFESAFAAMLAHRSAQGFGLEASTATPHWATYTGRNAGRVLELRAVASCGGAALAAVELIYPASRRAELAAVANRIAASLRATDAPCSPLEP